MPEAWPFNWIGGTLLHCFLGFDNGPDNTYCLKHSVFKVVQIFLNIRIDIMTFEPGYNIGKTYPCA